MREGCKVGCYMGENRLRIQLNPINEGRRSFSDVQNSVKLTKNRWNVACGLRGPHPEPLENYLDVILTLALC